jgi:dTDP-glucose 4,6-dehydratase
VSCGPVTAVPLKARGHRYRLFNVPTSLVTGGAGFTGSHLCDDLRRLGHELICVDSLDTGSLQNIEHIAHRDDFMFVNHDLTQPLFLDDEIDYLFHLPSPAFRPASTSEAYGDRQVNPQPETYWGT